MEQDDDFSVSLITHQSPRISLSAEPGMGMGMGFHIDSCKFFVDLLILRMKNG